MIRWFLERLGDRAFPNGYFEPKRNLEVIHQAYQEVFGAKPMSGIGAEASRSELLKRSFAQYLCQQKLVDRSTRLVTTVACLGALFPLLVGLLVKAALNWFERLFKVHQSVETVIYAYTDHYKNLIPQRLLERPAVILFQRQYQLTARDIVYVISLCSALPTSFLHPVFLFKVFLHISAYSWAISRYRPKMVVDIHERSCSVSAVTAYCRDHQVRHVNIMHGERAPIAAYAFIVFDTFYVWGSYYARMFQTLLAPPDQFTVVGNPVHKRLYQQRYQPRPSEKTAVIYYEYVLSKPVYRALVRRLVKKLLPGWNVIIRMRPPAKYEPDLRKEFLGDLLEESSVGDRLIQVQDSRVVNILDCISNSDLAIAVYSTALMDAWIAGRKVIRLRSRYDRFIIPPGPYQTSPNVFECDEDILGSPAFQAFLQTPWADDTDLVGEISYQDFPVGLGGN